jgi:hypothetical protein
MKFAQFLFAGLILTTSAFAVPPYRLSPGQSVWMIDPQTNRDVEVTCGGRQYPPSRPPRPNPGVQGCTLKYQPNSTGCLYYQIMSDLNAQQGECHVDLQDALDNLLTLERNQMCKTRNQGKCEVKYQPNSTSCLYYQAFVNGQAISECLMGLRQATDFVSRLRNYNICY